MEGGFVQFAQLYKKLRKAQKVAKPLLIGFVTVLCLVLVIAGCVVLTRSDSNSGVSLVFSGMAIGLGFGMTLIYNKLACASWDKLERAMDTAASFVPG